MVVLSLFCCLVCFHSWWDLGLPSNVLVKNLGLEATFALCWDVCGVRTPSCPYLPWEGRLVFGLVVAWASVTTNCLQDLEMRRHESRIQLLHAAGGQSLLGSSQDGWVQLSFAKEDLQKAKEQHIPLCGKARNFSRSPSWLSRDSMRGRWAAREEYESFAWPLKDGISDTSSWAGT